ncbi:MAG: Rieske (2Fe-2S) protein [Chloroflexi bacterium]|nr:MAG: Rieske (2Fe-2S) protein [Chloroflexota bacterium]
MNGKRENRIDKIVSGLLRGRRLKLRAGDAEEKAAITVAARLAAARQGPQRMAPAFRKKLASVLEQAPKQDRVTRRAALVAGLGIAAGVAGGTLLGRATQPGIMPAAGATIDPVNGRWIDVAAMSDLAEGQGKRVKAGGVGAFLFRRGQTVTAVSSICSHLPCELWWDRSTSYLACPCHPASFQPDGKPADGYALPALNPVQVRVTAEGRIEVLGTE